MIRAWVQRVFSLVQHVSTTRRPTLYIFSAIFSQKTMCFFFFRQPFADFGNQQIPDVNPNRFPRWLFLNRP